MDKKRRIFILTCLFAISFGMFVILFAMKPPDSEWTSKEESFIFAISFYGTVTGFIFLLVTFRICFKYSTDERNAATERAERGINTQSKERDSPPSYSEVMHEEAPPPPYHAIRKLAMSSFAAANAVSASLQAPSASSNRNSLTSSFQRVWKLTSSASACRDLDSLRASAMSLISNSRRRRHSLTHSASEPSGSFCFKNEAATGRCDLFNKEGGCYELVSRSRSHSRLGINLKRFRSCPGSYSLSH